MKIVGNTVGMGLPKPNLKQTDPRKGDFVKGKDEIPSKLSQLENDTGYMGTYILSEGETIADAPADAGVVIDPCSDEAVFPEDMTGGGIDVQGAVPGQTIVVKAVDENGKPTEWEAVDFPEGGGTQSDWNAAEGEPGHILNRPFYSEFTESVILPKCNIEYDEDGNVIDISEIPLFNLIPGNEYTVNWNGVHYKCIAEEMQIDGDSVAFIGDIGFIETGTPVTGEPFLIGTIEGNIELAPLDGSTSVTLSITCVVETITHISEKYLPQNGLFYRDSNNRLYKTADTSNPDNRVIKSELLDMVNRGMQLWVGLTDNGETVYVPVTSVRITDIAAFVRAEYVNGSTSTYVSGYAFNTRYAE